MITRENIKAVVASISEKDKKRIKNTNKEFIVLELICGNAEHVVKVTLTNNYDRYKNVSKYGNCMLYSEDTIFDRIK